MLSLKGDTRQGPGRDRQLAQVDVGITGVTLLSRRYAAARDERRQQEIEAPVKQAMNTRALQTNSRPGGGRKTREQCI